MDWPSVVSEAVGGVIFIVVLLVLMCDPGDIIRALRGLPKEKE